MKKVLINRDDYSGEQVAIRYEGTRVATILDGDDFVKFVWSDVLGDCTEDTAQVIVKKVGEEIARFACFERDGVWTAMGWSIGLPCREGADPIQAAVRMYFLLGF